MNQCFIDGKRKEYEFADLLLKRFGGRCSEATKQQDIHDHIDLIWTIDDKTYTFDIKGLKKNHRHDDQVDGSMHWIEFINVHGEPGWLYGKADWLVFECIDRWLFVMPKVLMQSIHDKLRDSKIYYKDPGYYQLYQRKNRSDIVVKVPIEDLASIASKTLFKDEREL